jgi:hypothetical protein
MHRMENKRAILINYITNLSESEIDTAYDNIIENVEPNAKMNFIINTLQPLISFLYFSLNNEQIEQVFQKKRDMLK